jgi:hypothetical protein
MLIYLMYDYRLLMYAYISVRKDSICIYSQNPPFGVFADSKTEKSTIHSIQKNTLYKFFISALQKPRKEGFEGHLHPVALPANIHIT